VLGATSVPQGWTADSYLKAPHPGSLKTWAAWGLTEPPAQPLFWALVALFVGSGILGALRARVPAGGGVAHRLRARAARPEDAPEEAASALRGPLGEPEHAEWDGEATRLRYALGPKPSDGLRSHLGLAVVFVAGVYVVQPPPPAQTVARAELAAEEARTGARGTFDLVEGEEFTFFQSPTLYVLREYRADRLGLGPALQMTWREPGGEGFGSFWIYASAPRGFDARHRGGDIGFDVLRARLEPIPGAGPTARPASWLLILGIGLLILGASARLQPTVQTEVVCRGPNLEVRMSAPAGSRTERTWKRVRSAIEESFPVLEAG